MEICKKILQQANIIPRLQLVRKKEGGGTEGTGPHRVKLFGDKACKVKNFKTGEVEFGVELLVEENGEKKRYCFPMKGETGEVHYLVQKMANFNIGDEVIMEYKRQPGMGTRGMIDVVLAEKPKEKEVKSPLEIKTKEIPIVEDEDYGEPPEEVFE